MCSAITKILGLILIPRPTGHVWPRMAMHVAPHKIVNLLKALFEFLCDYVSQYIQCVAQDNSSSSSVAQRHQKFARPYEVWCVCFVLPVSQPFPYLLLPGKHTLILHKSQATICVKGD